MNSNQTVVPILILAFYVEYEQPLAMITIIMWIHTLFSREYVAILFCEYVNMSLIYVS